MGVPPALDPVLFSGHSVPYVLKWPLDIVPGVYKMHAAIVHDDPSSGFPDTGLRLHVMHLPPSTSVGCPPHRTPCLSVYHAPNTHPGAPSTAVSL